LKKSKNSLKNRIYIIVFLVMVFSGLSVSYSRVFCQEKENYYIGVVDIDKLLKAHEKWSELQKLDEKIAILEKSASLELTANRLEEAEKKFTSLVSEYENRMKKKQEEVSSSWVSKQDAISAQLEALQYTFKARQAEEMNRIMAENEVELKDLQKKFEAEISAKLAAQAAAIEEKYKPEMDKENEAIQAILDQYLDTLLAERDKKVQEKRTGLELELDSVLSAERNRLNSQLEEYKQKRLAQNQQELMQINLQINKFNSSSSLTKEDEAELKKLMAERDAINQSYQADIEGKSVDLDGSFNSFRDKKVAEIEAELGVYTEELNKAMQTKIEPKKQELDSILKTKLAKIEEKINKELKTFQEPIVAEYDVIMAKRQSEMEASAQQRLDAMSGQFAAEFEAAKNALIAGLDQQQGEIKGELDKFGKQMQKEFDSKREELEKELYETQQDTAIKKQDEIKAVINKRTAIFEEIMKDISEKVKKVSEPEKISVVITGYWLNVDSVDLTDKVLSLMSLTENDSDKENNN